MANDSLTEKMLPEGRPEESKEGNARENLSAVSASLQAQKNPGTKALKWEWVGPITETERRSG